MRHFPPPLTAAELAAEEWRAIPGRAREVSNLGRVRDTATGVLVEPCIVNGYRKVPVRGRNEYVHRLVLLAFVGPCPPGHVAAHGGNGNRADNRATNLRWATHRENAADRYAQGTMDTALRPYLSELGRTPDAEIARRCGLGRSAVQNYRKRRGIPRAPAAPTPRDQTPDPSDEATRAAFIRARKPTPDPFDAAFAEP